MKKNIISAISLFLIFAGCAGRESNPVPAYYPGDEKRSCMSLQAEMAQIQNNIQRLSPYENKFWTNTFWFLFFTPLMDLKDAEKIEIEAYRQRYNRLMLIATEKNCDFIPTDVNEVSINTKSQ